MDTTVRYRRGVSSSPAIAFHDVFRIGANDWGLTVGAFKQSAAGQARWADEIRRMVRTGAKHAFRPSEVLGSLSASLRAEDPEGHRGCLDSMLFARLELDACGAWVTLANAGEVRPIAVRQAGWIDVRGHVASPPGSEQLISPGDDRVGLGPGDALVVCGGAIGVADAHGDPYDGDTLPELLLHSIGLSAEGMAERVVAVATEIGDAPLQDDSVLLVVRVPGIQRGRSLERVAEATGIPLDKLDLPGYPLGDAQPDLWKAPAKPPREARISLTPEPLSVPALRRLLRRLLQSWRMEAEGDLELLATEVATNLFAGAFSPVTVLVRYDGDQVRVEMGGGAEDRPGRILPGYDELSGPGLLLIEALSSEWGVKETRGGKRVWFEVPAVPRTEP